MSFAVVLIREKHMRNFLQTKPSWLIIFTLLLGFWWALGELSGIPFQGLTIEHAKMPAAGPMWHVK